MICISDSSNILSGKLPCPAVYQVAHIPGINKQNLIHTVAELPVGLNSGSKTHRLAGICVFRKSFAGRLTMQSTRRASINPLRISPSPDVLEVSAPLASTKTGLPVRAKMIKEVLYPGIVGISHRRGAILPPAVFPEQFAAPVAVIKGRIGYNIIGLSNPCGRHSGMSLRCSTSPVSCRCYAYSKVHLCQPPGSLIAFLAVIEISFLLPLMVADKFLGLHEHTAPNHSRGQRHALYEVQASQQAIQQHSSAYRNCPPFLPSASANSPRKYSNTWPRTSALLAFASPSAIFPTRSIMPPRFSRIKITLCINLWQYIPERGIFPFDSIHSIIYGFPDSGLPGM